MKKFSSFQAVFLLLLILTLYRRGVTKSNWQSKEKRDQAGEFIKWRRKGERYKGIAEKEPMKVHDLWYNHHQTHSEVSLFI